MDHIRRLTKRTVGAMSAIIKLAREMLDKQELGLAEHLAALLADDKYDAGNVVAAILPRYSEGQQTLRPDSVYRTLYYVDQYTGLRDFQGKTRTFLDMVSGHIEGCLFHLYVGALRRTNLQVPFGPMVQTLHDRGLLSDELASQLQAFNKVVNVPSKHFNAHFLPSTLDERTFTVAEAACAFVMMRKLSVPLFALLKKQGVELKGDWPPFDPKWLAWSPLVPSYHPSQEEQEEF
jgi:hypothetical protein